MHRYQPSTTGITFRSHTGWFHIVRPTGRGSRRLFRSPFRAAEFACKAYGKPWPELHLRGFTVQEYP